jgi:hypothetical protein
LEYTRRLEGLAGDTLGGNGGAFAWGYLTKIKDTVVSSPSEHKSTTKRSWHWCKCRHFHMDCLYKLAPRVPSASKEVQQ